MKTLLGTVTLLGLPTDSNSSYLRGAAAAPQAIRKALHSGASNMTAENGVDVGQSGLLLDAGDVALTETPEDFDRIVSAVGGERGRGRRVLCLGGDHFVTYPILRATAESGLRPSILHFDAHPDLYDLYEGNRFSHASPFARIMEEGLASRLVQVGIRTLNAHQGEQARRFGVTIVHMRDFTAEAVPVLEGPVYVSIDLDGLDPAYAPGVSHLEPGGLSVRDLLSVLGRVAGPVIGADVVELNPSRDVGEMTATVAAKLVKELAGRMAEADP
jgi:arginase